MPIPRPSLGRGIAAVAALLLASRAAADLPPLQDTPGRTLVYEDDFLGVSGAPCSVVDSASTLRRVVPLRAAPLRAASHRAPRRIARRAMRLRASYNYRAACFPPPPPQPPLSAPNPDIFNVADGYVHTQFDLVCYVASEAFVENGNLVLRTRALSVECGGRNFSWVSGWVDTNGRLSVRDGKVEVRALLPPPTFRVWPASFLISEKNNRDTGECWPTTTEIDLYEVAGGFNGQPQFDSGLGLNAMCASYHWGTECFVDLGATKTGCKTAEELDYAGSFHTYGTEWDETSIVYSVDDVVFYKQDRENFPGIIIPVPDPMVLIMQTALAWWILPQDISAPPQFPLGQDFTHHFIDWIRVWKRSE